MPFVLIALGILFLVVAVQGTQGDLFTLLKSEFVGENSFVVFAAAFIILGLLGYIKQIRPVAHAFMALVFLGLVLSNKGFFAKLNQALRNPVTPTATAAPAATAQTAGAAPAGTSQVGQINGGVPEVTTTEPDAVGQGYDVQPIPGL